MNAAIGYLLASLPDLAPGRRAPIGLAEFHARCVPHLSAADLRRLEALELTRTPESPAPRETIRRWHEREEALRVELAVLRARRLHRDAARWESDPRRTPEAAEIARRIFARSSPAEAEAELDRARWAILDDLELGHDLDLDRLALYGLKLRLLERAAGFDDARGHEAVRERMDEAHAVARAVLER